MFSRKISHVFSIVFHIHFYIIWKTAVLQSIFRSHRFRRDRNRPGSVSIGTQGVFHPFAGGKLRWLFYLHLRGPSVSWCFPQQRKLGDALGVDQCFPNSFSSWSGSLLGKMAWSFNILRMVTLPWFLFLHKLQRKLICAKSTLKTSFSFFVNPCNRQFLKFHPYNPFLGKIETKRLKHQIVFYEKHAL